MNFKKGTSWLLILLLVCGNSAVLAEEKPNPVVKVRKAKDPRRRLFDPLLNWIGSRKGEGDSADGDGKKKDQAAEEGDSANGNSSGLGSAGTGGNAKGPSGTSTNVYVDQGKGGEAGEGAPDNTKKKDVSATPIGDGQGGSRGIAFPKFYPMCLFIAGDVTQDANAAVKGLIDEAAACQVNLVVYPITVRPLPDKEAPINAMQTKACNIAQALGVSAASTSSCISGTQAPAEMCNVPKFDPQTRKQIGWDESVGGCAQLNAAGGGKLDMSKINTANGSASIQQYSGGAGGAVPSIERSGSCTASVVGHEALGHSQMGKPNGSDHGNGIGDPDPNNPAPPGSEGSGSGGWTGKGCATMYANAFGNDGRYRWNPNQQTYYVHKTDPAQQIDLAQMKPLFAKGGKPVSGGQSIAVASQPPRRGGDENLQRRNPSQSDASLSSSPSANNPHKKGANKSDQPVDPKTQDIIARNKKLKVIESGPEMEIGANNRGPGTAEAGERPPVTLGPVISSQQRYDDGAQYKSSGGGGSIGLGGGGPSGAGPSQNGSPGGSTNVWIDNKGYGSGDSGGTSSLEVSGGFGRTPAGSVDQVPSNKKGEKKPARSSGRKPGLREGGTTIRTAQPGYNGDSAD